VERQNSIRQELAMALAAVHTQMLLPKKGGGRVPAAELLMVGYGARHHIRRNRAATSASGNSRSPRKRDHLRSRVLWCNWSCPTRSTAEDALLCSIHPDDLDILLKSSSSAAATAG